MEPSQNAQSAPLWKKVIFYFFATFLIGTIIIETYVGLVTFFYCSMLIVITYVAGMLGFVAIGAGTELAQGVLWCFYAVPLLEALLIVNLDILQSFFSRIWRILSYRGLMTYIDNRLAHPKCRRSVNYAILMATFLAIAFFAFLLMRALLYGGKDPSTMFNFLLGGFAVIAPVLAFLKTFAAPWKTLFCCRGLWEDRNSQLKEDIECEWNSVSEGNVNEERARLSLIDPCQLMCQQHWTSIMNSDCNIFWTLSKGECSFELIVAIFALLCEFAYLCLDWISLYMDQKRRTDGGLGTLWTEYLYAGLRVAFAIWTAPFVMSWNMSVLFTKWSKLARFGVARAVKIVATVIMITILVIFGISGVLLTFVFTPNAIRPVYSNVSGTETSINASDAASFCGLDFGGWSVLELAGLSMVTQSGVYETGIVHNLTKEILGHDTAFTMTNLSGTIAPGFLVQKENTDRPVLAYQGVKQKTQMAVLFENIVAYWYTKAMMGVVPFFLFTHEFFLHGFLNTLANNLGFAALGFRSLSSRLVADVNHHSQIWEGMTDYVPIFTGHSQGGLAAKYSSGQYNGYSVAFESPMLTLSRLDLSITDVNGAPHSFVMANVYSGVSAFAFAETNLTTNIKIPGTTTIMPRDVYETFCRVVAGCATTNRYDRLCVAAVGQDMYENYFKGWERDRSPVDPGEPLEK